MKPVTVPLSQKISGNRSYSVVFVFFFFECFFLSEKELALLSVCFSWAHCALDVSRGQQFSQRKYLLLLAVLLHVANVLTGCKHKLNLFLMMVNYPVREIPGSSTLCFLHCAMQ